MLKIFFLFKQISKCDTCFYTHFSRAFQKYSFQICSFSHKKVMGYFRFFLHTPDLRCESVNRFYTLSTIGTYLLKNVHGLFLERIIPILLYLLYLSFLYPPSQGEKQKLPAYPSPNSRRRRKDFIILYLKLRRHLHNPETGILK